MEIAALSAEISACTLCRDRFAATETAHAPRPVPWLSDQARILVSGQAPGARVHASGRPFDDPSGDRLRDWMGIGREVFYDPSRVAVLPMAFCFPGYRKGSDLPPPPVCQATWHGRAMAAMGQVELILAIGAYAQRFHLGRRAPVSAVVADWRNCGPRIIPLPHPSWRNSAWLKRHPWFETDLLPVLRARIGALI